MNICKKMEYEVRNVKQATFMIKNIFRDRGCRDRRMSYKWILVNSSYSNLDLIRHYVFKGLSINSVLIKGI